MGKKIKLVVEVSEEEYAILLAWNNRKEMHFFDKNRAMEILTHGKRVALRRKEDKK